MSILIFIIILLVLVLVHEAGHFFTAKSFGIRVDEFGFGFPPKIFSFKKGETEYSLNLLPLGGFVKIFGESVDEVDTLEVGFLDKKETPEKMELAKRSLAHKPKWQQALVLVAGIVANFLLAWLLFSLSFMSGFPTSVGSEIAVKELSDVNLVVTSVLQESPAEKAGLKTGDKIIGIKNSNDSTTDVSPEAVISFVVESNGEEIIIEYTRGKNTEINTTKVVPVIDQADGRAKIGISMDQIGTVKLPVFMAFWEGLRLDWFMTKGTVIGLYTLVKEGIQGNGSLDAVIGPVGLVGIVGDAYEFGFIYLMSFATLISINLAIINLLPFPALDGGRLLFLLIEKMKGSRINPKIANTVNAMGFYLLILLMLVITYHDVVKLF
ncbi:MAG: Membrane-associated zinc metalloprotease [Candidatus Nomurabacteria bacterium GW2011_GWB1_40_7]|uniref:Zinc metalloprotease n=1 Tax=Candidatus Nomurabacteria bacterium GW2011_GWB1_40_7 TaxID=1618744 RepID=A0A0G0T0V1_9BACT|nr:MAG: Membrane-associated zinc metalloprotease [Candidatus Nomurabacteria bacterium GW2011_GWB1_40_7]